MTAQVGEGEAGAPTGLVTFTYEGGALGSGALDGSGQASIIASSLPVGIHTITATYSGDASLSGSASPHVQLKVGYSTAVSITAHAPDPSVVGQPILISLNVTSNQGTPTGTVVVVTGVGTPVCYAALTDGLGSCQITPTEPGPVSLAVTYMGDANFNSSTATGSHRVNKMDTTITITAHTPDPSGPGQPVTVEFTRAVVPPGAGTPTGPVVVSASGGQETCTGVLTGGVGSCQITLTKSGLRTLTAAYAGDNLFNGSVSAGQPQQVGFISRLPIMINPAH